MWRSGMGARCRNSCYTDSMARSTAIGGLVLVDRSWLWILESLGFAADTGETACHTYRIHCRLD